MGRKKRRGFWLRLSEHATTIRRPVLAGCGALWLEYSAIMNDEPSSGSVLSALWQQIRAVLDLVLDLSFKRFVTPQLVRMLYVLSLLAAVYYAWKWMWDGLWGFITAPLVFLLFLIVARVTVELILAIFRVADKIAPLSEEEEKPKQNRPVRPAR